MDLMGVFDELLNMPQENSASRVPSTIQGIVTGMVKQNWDKDHPGMVQVEYFLGEQGKNLTGWVPIMAPYAGKEFGAYMLPEVGSEVVLAFQMGDRNCPLVIGCIWNKQNALPKETANEKNTVKKLLTKGGCEIQFSEESGKEQICIKTPKNLQILLEDEKETIQISDKDRKNGLQVDTKNGKLVLLADKGIELQVGGKAMIALDGNGAEISGTKITCKADQGLQAKGQTVSLEGTSVEVKGSGTLKLEASGTAQLKGAMVQIN